MRKVLICIMQFHKNTGAVRTGLEQIEFFKLKGYEVHVASMTMNSSTLKRIGVIPHKMFPWIKSTGLRRRQWYNFQIEKLKIKLQPHLIIGHGDIVEQDILTLHNSVFLACEKINQIPLSGDHEMAITHGKILHEKKFKIIIANSKMMKEDLISRFKIPPNQIEIIYPSLDIKTFYNQNNKEQLRKNFCFPQKIIISLITSGDLKKRGVDIFVKAIQSIPDDIKQNVSFRVIGKSSDYQYDASLVTFDPLIENIQDYYNAIDIFVLPARFEEFGRVVLEAMGTTLPVIITDNVGAGELLEQDSLNYIIPSNNVKALTQAIIELVISKDLRRKIGEINFKSARRIDKQYLLQKYEHLLDNLNFINH